MTRSTIMAAIVAALTISTAACSNNSELGASLVQDEITVVLDSAFTVTGHSVDIGRVQSRTSSQLIGRVDAQGFGDIASDVVTQFMPASTLVTDNVSVEDVDSLVMFMYMANGEFVGDSVAPMGLDVYRLTKALPSPIYSDFDPADYYSPADRLASVVYNIANNSADSIIAGGYMIRVPMPQALARELYASYLADPAAFAAPTTFADQVFKGVYIKNSFGSGRLIRVSSTVMSMYYHTHEVNAAGRDTTLLHVGNYFAVTPEIISNNNISLSLAESLDDRVAAGQAIVAAPVGLKVEMEFPAREVIASFRSSGRDVAILNSVTFSLPAEVIDNTCGFVPPTYLLMVLKSQEDEFFANNSLPDSKTSFYAKYNSATQTYDFGQVRNYILSLLDKGQLSPEDYTFSLVPVSCIFETNQGSYYTAATDIMTVMMPYIAAPTMGRLRLDRAKVKLTYSTQSIAQ